MIKYTETGKRSEAVMAECRDCFTKIEGNQYWSFRNSIWLHQSGTGHLKFRFYKVEFDNGIR